MHEVEKLKKELYIIAKIENKVGFLSKKIENIGKSLLTGFVCSGNSHFL